MTSFGDYYWAGRKGHLIGVGGVSMSPLAEVLTEAGLSISGSDMNEGDNVGHLRKLGIDVKIGHRPENVPADAEFVVRTAAVHDDNPEIVEALALDVSTNTESMVRNKLRKLRDKRLVRPVRIEERSNRVQWEAVQ